MTSQPIYKYPSMTSVQSMVGMGHMPPGHGYIPVRESRTEKPYGPSFVTVMNRMWRGPGRKYINYAIVCLSIAILFYVGGAVYFGHRNVARMKVMNTEVLGAFLIVVGILLTAAFFQLIYKANVESNRWRNDVRFKAEGLYTAAAYNQAYLPDDNEMLKSGTYGPMAIKELPRAARPQKSRGRSGMLRSGAQTPARSGLQTPNRSGFQTPGSYRNYDEADTRAQPRRGSYQIDPEPSKVQKDLYMEDKQPVRAQGAYYTATMVPVRAQGTSYYPEYSNFGGQPTYQSEKEREAFGIRDSTTTEEPTMGAEAPAYASILREGDELNAGPALVSTPQPFDEPPNLVLPPVKRAPVLPPVHRQPVTSSKKSQSEAFLG